MTQDLNRRLQQITRIKNIGTYIIENADAIDLIALSVSKISKDSDQDSTYEHLSLGPELAIVGLIELARHTLFEDVADRRILDDTD